jgi:Cu2+-exporting ATPase
LTGRGVQADVDGTAYAVGGPSLLRGLDVAVPADLARTAEDWSRRGAAVLHLIRLADIGKPDVIGAFALADEIRPEAREAVAQLRRQGVRSR